ncbi:MAG: signal recognition particle-docking protein FtsY, partial [Acidobacteria bacterium]|nr:signal recognition particle-docking protein FtsY [Acidobacteriota bacterium]
MVLGKWLSKLASGLTKTRSKLADGVRDLFRIGRKVDAQFLAELEETLILGDVGVAATGRIIEDLKARYRDREITADDDLLGVIKRDLKESIGEADRGIRFNPDGPTVVLVAGVNGSGKTTAVARLARLLLGEGKSVLLAACDTFRAAAEEQLRIWSERVGVDIVRHNPGADPAAVAFDAAEAAVARGVDVLVVDTAGRLHTQQHLMRELGKICRVLEKKIPGAPHEVLLVLDATTGQNAIAQAKQFREAIDVTGVFLAKLDGTAKGGIVLAIKKELGIPVKFIGIG